MRFWHLRLIPASDKGDGSHPSTPPQPGARCCAKPLEHSFNLLSYASEVARGWECLPYSGTSSSVPSAMIFPLSPQGLPQLFILPSTLLQVIRLCHHPLAWGHPAAGQGFADLDALGPLYLSRLCQPCSIPFQGETPHGRRTTSSGCTKAHFQCQASGKEALPARVSQPIPDISQHLHRAPKQEFSLGDAAISICHFHASSWQGPS